MPSCPLFPPIEPYRHGMLPVDDLHTLYWEECGNPEGLPVVFLHGGPGAGCNSLQRRLFDPETWRIVLFDQRGSGRSIPPGETRANTPQHLIEDIERVRRFLGIEKWHVVGGSWGSTLGLAYAETYPEGCLGLILRGIFLFRQCEIDWFIYGMRTVFPEVWEKFADFIPKEEQYDLLGAYCKIFAGRDIERKMEAAHIWQSYERACSTFYPGDVSASNGSNPHDFSAMPFIEAYYLKYNKLAVNDLLLREVNKIRHIPGTIIQGRYDMVCPIATAYELHCAWPEADYRVIPDAGHATMESGICNAIIEATERMKRIKE